MVAGHFATALVPASRLRGGPLWLFLLAAMVPDYLYFLLSLFGLERPLPVEFWTTSLKDMHGEMPYSHSGFSILVQALVMGGIAWFTTREPRAVLWCGALVVGHYLCDLLAGFQHEIAGIGSPMIGFNFYNNAPVMALALEALLSAGCVFWLVRGRRRSNLPLTPRQKVLLYVVFVGGSFLLLPIANESLLDSLSSIAGPR
ncbi:MAG: hypothetical protein HYY13_07085 [Nitrospirae bacterium]|nr:hypothetical protein [Nitrospirota bacterium]